MEELGFHYQAKEKKCWPGQSDLIHQYLLFFSGVEMTGDTHMKRESPGSYVWDWALNPSCSFLSLSTSFDVFIVILLLQLLIRRRQWHPTPVLLPGKSHGCRSLEGCSPWGRWGSDTTEWLPFHFSLSCTGEGNGNPLQCSCLEDLRDGGAWWAAIYGAAESRTRLKRLSSSSSSSSC